MRPLILISNDDGIDSPYLLGLADALEQTLDVELLVVAPERQRSAMSHTITLHKPLRVANPAPGRYAVSGSPVDCVYIGLLKLAPRPPALVVSGINDGYNLGTDVFYSGTVGAAFEGGLRGIPSVAFSLAPRAHDALAQATDFATGIIGHLLESPFSGAPVINVNVPANASGRYRWTKLGKRYYEDDVHERKDPRGRSYFWIGGGIAGIEEMAGSDCEAIAEGLVSLTPLALDLTAHAVLGEVAPVLSFDGAVHTPRES
jgi:5'-nucleotidase